MTGRTLGGRYEILDKIDSGGMADVYKSRCKTTGRIVAVKVLKEKFAKNSEYTQRFIKEAETVFFLEHKNIVSVSDFGCDDGTYYMVMEFIEGRTLKSSIKDNKGIGENNAVRYAMQLCAALSSAHKKGIIHRDIKPQNILIDESGEVKLTDFGIAKSSSTDESPNQVIGSVHYISPEQASGETVDQRTDIYSLGIVLYEMLTGTLPHTGGKTVSVALKQINEQIKPPSEINKKISKSINAIVLKATDKNKDKRYQSAEEFKRDLVLSVADPNGSLMEIEEALEYPISKAGAKNHMIWKTGILAVLGLVLAAAVVTGTTMLAASGKGIVSLPDVVGTTLSDAQTKLSGLTVESTYAPSEIYDAGVVISQNPSAGSDIKTGNIIDLTISSGPAILVMPDLTGMTVEEAKNKIESMGIEIDDSDITYEKNTEMPEGSVFAQAPEVGSELTGDYVLNLVVSGGDSVESGSMPKLTDLPVDQAVELLKNAGFNNFLVYEQDDSKAEGTVVSQSKDPGAQALVSDDIGLWISRYKDKPYKGSLNEIIDVPEKDSKIRIVIQEEIDGIMVNFFVNEFSLDAGSHIISEDISCLSQGLKRVTVYINNKVFDTYEVNFFG